MILCLPQVLTKQCSSCLKTKDNSLFYKNKHNIDGLQPSCKDCSCKMSKNSINKSKSTLKGFIQYIVLTAKRGSIYRGLQCDITYTDVNNIYIKQKGKCALSNRKLTISTSGNTLNNISIDRIDNTKGYHKDNIQLVCLMVNKMKSNFNQEDFIAMCKDIN